MSSTGRLAERNVFYPPRKGLAAVVPIEDIEILENSRIASTLRMPGMPLRESGRKGTVSWEKIKRDLGL
jgi:hypothetical protein